MKKLYKKHIAVRNKPKNLKDEDSLLFKHEFSKEINTTTLQTVKDADIVNHLIFSARKLRFYPKYTRLNKVSFKQKIKTLLSLLLLCKKVNKGVWITDDLSINYFHWFTDALPRLLASENFLDGHAILLPYEYEKQVYVIQSLKILNFDIIFFDPKKRLHVKQLILPSHTAPTGNYNKDIINKVRNRFFSDFPDTGNKKIYISRQKAIRRKITNENELMQQLKLYGFAIHFFEDYDFYRQVEIVQQATHLIGLHGAGLTNMLFMHKNGKILELRNEGDDHNNCYFSLASDLGHDYYYLVCKGDNQNTLDANLTVDINSLKLVIEQML